MPLFKWGFPLPSPHLPLHHTLLNPHLRARRFSFFFQHGLQTYGQESVLGFYQGGVNAYMCMFVCMCLCACMPACVGVCLCMRACLCQWVSGFGCDCACWFVESLPAAVPDAAVDPQVRHLRPRAARHPARGARRDVRCGRLRPPAVGGGAVPGLVSGRRPFHSAPL